MRPQAPGPSHFGPGGRVLLIVALMVCTFLTAIDVLILVTAMPTIVASMGGLDLYSWVFSSYMLASVASMPIYGKLADVHGRKPIFTLGTGLFLVGSLLCGSAQSMEQLVVFRVVQGLGAGGIQPITVTILGDVFGLEERARLSGLFSLVWGLASILGPPVGGLLTELLSWRFIFYVNLPIGLLAIGLLWLTLQERVERRPHRIDYLGSALLATGLVALQLGILEAQQEAGRPPTASLALVAVSLALGWLFVRNERRVAEPVLPLDLFRNRLIAISSVGSLLTGAVLLSTTSFLPPFVQGVLGLGASMAGWPLVTMSVAWAAASAVVGRVIVRAGYRVSGVLGGVCLVCGAAALAAGVGGRALVPISVAVGVMGFGFGALTLTFVLSVQNAVPWERRGVATSANQLFRTIGGSLGVSAAGAVFAATLKRELAQVAGAERLDPNLLLDAAGRAALPAELVRPAVGALEGSLVAAFAATSVVALCAGLVVLLLPGGPASRHQWAPPRAGGRETGAARPLSEPSSSIGR